MEAVKIETVVERETRYAARSARYAVGEKILILMREFMGDNQKKAEYKSRMRLFRSFINTPENDLGDTRLKEINALLTSLEQKINRKDFLDQQFRSVVFPKTDMTSIRQPVYAHVFPRLTVRELIQFEMESEANKILVDKYFQLSVRAEDMQRWFGEVLTTFHGYSRYSYALSCFHASLLTQDNQARIQNLGEGLVHLLRGSEDVITVSFLHHYYQFHGGRASLSNIRDKANELNKREVREKSVRQSTESAGTVACASCPWVAIGWIGFGCCCPGNACCCGINIAISALCGLSTATGLTFNAERIHGVVRSNCCDVEYDLEEVHPAAQDFSSQLPPVVEMEAMEIEEDEPARPSCFQSVVNFFRSQNTNNNTVVEDERVRDEPRP